MLACMGHQAQLGFLNEISDLPPLVSHFLHQREYVQPPGAGLTVFIFSIAGHFSSDEAPTAKSSPSNETSVAGADVPSLFIRSSGDCETVVGASSTLSSSVIFLLEEQIVCCLLIFTKIGTFFHSFDCELLVVSLFLQVQTIARLCIVITTSCLGSIFDLVHQLLIF